MSYGYKASCFMQGVFKTGVDYIFMMLINPKMRKAIRSFAELNSERGKEIEWPEFNERRALHNLIEKIQDQLTWIDNQRRNRRNVDFDPTRSAFGTAGVNGGWPYVVLFTATERFRDLFEENDEHTIRKTLLHLDTQCSLLDDQFKRREEDYEEKAEVSFADEAVSHE